VSAPRGWSLAGRLTRLFLVSTSLFVLLISAASAWFLAGSTERELAALLHEEIDEVGAAFPHSAADRAAFEEITAEDARQHPATPFAWRVWDADGRLWGEFGRKSLLSPDAPARDVLDRAVEAPEGLRWRVQRIETGQLVGCVLDGSAQLAMVRHYGYFAGAVLLASLAAALVLGRLFFQRVSRLLGDVARGARRVRTPEADVALDLPGAPREIREVVEALGEMLGNIRAEMTQARVFTAGLAHELRSPVQNLIGEAEVALMAERDAGRYREVLHSHLEELHELADAIDNLIAICSAQETRQSRAREDFDLGEEAEIRLRRERTVAERHGVRLHVTAQGDLRLFGDREAILRALRNLTANAIEWSSPGDRVDVELRGERDEVVVTVDDGGPGVPPELRERIFKPFFRGPEHRPHPAAGRRAGYGLGLGMVRSAVETHGGTVHVTESPAGGARFRMRLPREGRTAASEEPRAERLVGA
jgi:signal transduction histidine kinase